MDNHYFTIHWDKKLLKYGKAYTHKEHLAVLASATNGKLVKLLSTTDLDNGTGLNQTKAIKNMLQEWSIEQQCVEIKMAYSQCIFLLLILTSPTILI